MLHIELEVIDQRVIGARSRALQQRRTDQPSTSAALMRGRRRKMHPRWRGAPAPSSDHEESAIETVPIREPEFDDDGNVITPGDILRSSLDSSLSNHSIDMDEED
ncbi:hypothetical protein KP509_22G038300 [Ceratopteris richardii]|uniref:Uncharacterized protein n=1 Tax=Ceratopteris richardii TaxID=49495 RepID=A0A8T2S548_CERRI|nr:hypothetical protein KP509_22G038300 [Ceratopteris richardii]